MRYRLIISALLLLNSVIVSAQSFFLTEKSDVVYTGINSNSDDWKSLDISEAPNYLRANGFEQIKTSNASGFQVYQGYKTWNYSSHARLLRSLMFKESVVVGCSDVIEFVVPCNACLVEPMKQFAYKTWEEAKEFDQDLRRLFLKEHKKSLSSDGVSTELYGMSDDQEFSYSNSNQGNPQISRNCKLTLENGSVYRYLSGRSVKLVENQYMVGDDNLKEINQYDLNKMVVVFLNDCSNHGIEIGKNEVIVSMKSLSDNLIGLSFGMNDDAKIEMVVDPQRWAEASPPKRWYILYHELGHDVLNLEHGQAGKMMFNFADKGYSWEEFWKDKEYMLNVVSQ